MKRDNSTKQIQYIDMDHLFTIYKKEPLKNLRHKISGLSITTPLGLSYTFDKKGYSLDDCRSAIDHFWQHYEPLNVKDVVEKLKKNELREGQVVHLRAVQSIEIVGNIDIPGLDVPILSAGAFFRTTSKDRFFDGKRHHTAYLIEVDNAEEYFIVKVFLSELSDRPSFVDQIGKAFDKHHVETIGSIVVLDETYNGHRSLISGRKNQNDKNATSLNMGIKLAAVNFIESKLLTENDQVQKILFENLWKYGHPT